CNVCGPEDVLCHKYGLHLLARSRGFEGANSRFHRVLRDAQAGKPIKIAGSVSVGHGVTTSEQWLHVFGAWWEFYFTGGLQIQNGALRATGTAHFSMCFKEQIDDDADLIITEFAINDQRTEENAENFELLLRQLLELPKRPAVLNLQVLSLGFTRLTAGGDLHTAIAEYYDTPVISLRNALLPQLVETQSSIRSFFSAKRDGSVDAMHINAKGHQMAGELLTAYTQRQICAMAQQDTLASEYLIGTSEASQLLLDLDKMPAYRLFSGLNDPPALVLDPYCSSTRSEKHPLIPEYNDRWSNWTWSPPNGGKPKKYVVAQEPGAKIGFKVPVRGGGMGRVRMRYLRSKQYGLGIARCWLDEDTAHEVRVDGYWGHAMNIAFTTVLSSNATKGEHMLWCEMTGHTNSPDGGREFRFIGVDSV
ncbi:hypothetical protein BKA62DRAFT_617848, partial [Auriculariales sp. MPI-PUGE-AT-0066]